jgi:hypothetical protein
MKKLIILLYIFSILLQAKITDYDIKPSNLKSSTFMNIKILDSKELQLNEYKDIKVSELSALAYKNNILYALSDSGYMYHFDIEIKDKKIITLNINKALKLKNKKNKKLKNKKKDAEGMAFMNDKLLISFERIPRVELYSLKGIKKKNIKINKELKYTNNYQSKNRALESVAYNEEYGVITAPESPLKNSSKQLDNYHILYAKNRIWKFPIDGKITALEFINKHKTSAILEKLHLL